MLRALALPALLAAAAAPPFHAASSPLAHAQRAQLRHGGFWQKGCPVGLGDLRALRVTIRGWDRRAHTGELVVNRRAVAPLTSAFRALYEARFPIRHMRFADFYGPRSARPADGDVTAAFECRQAVPSPCTGGTGTGTWSNHAYGLAVDIDPRENPYVGCGQSRDPTAQAYRDRSKRRKGMVGPKAVAAFRAAGWGWGGAWTGSTKDYMHFSFNGH